MFKQFHFKSLLRSEAADLVQTNHPHLDTFVKVMLRPVEDKQDDTRCFHKHQPTDGGKESLRKLLVRVERHSCARAGLHCALVAKTDGVCELSRPLALLLVCTYTCICAKENVQVTLCAQTRPAGGHCCVRMQKAFLCPI